MELLLRGAASLGITLELAQQDLFTRYYQELVEWNRRVNLTSVTQWEEVQTVHFLDSLTVACALDPGVLQTARVLDVGSGAGFPGLPLKIVFPMLRMGLLEAREKKAAFLRHMVEALELRDVEVYSGRAEELAQWPAMREQFDYALARGLAKMPVLAELALPFVRVGGALIAQKKGRVDAEVADAEAALLALGGAPAEVRWLQVTGLPEPRALVVVPKRAPTPQKYPRRPGAPAKRPLGLSRPRPLAGGEAGVGGRR